MPNRNVKVYIQAYKQASEGAKTLQANLLAAQGAISRCWRRNNTDFPDTVAVAETVIKNCLMINWGTASSNFSLLPAKAGYFLLNGFGVITCQNKLNFFRSYSASPTLNLPSFWTDRRRVESFIENTNRGGEPVVVERHHLTGHSGQGIRLVKKKLELRDAPLYVQYIPKAAEYRVHFFKHPGMETEFFVQQKRLRRDAGFQPGGGIYKIRNHANGWVFCHNEVDENFRVLEQAKNFSQVTDLDFGAIDIIYTQRSDRATILEVNTAPGLEGETGKWYARQVNLAASRHNFLSVEKAYSVAV